MHWRERFDVEMANASRARARGNEGQARVCARRAAGLAAAEYLARRGRGLPSGSAMDALEQLRQETNLPASALLPLGHFLLKVSTEFKLPPDVDLLADAFLLRNLLFPPD